MITALHEFTVQTILNSLSFSCYSDLPCNDAYSFCGLKDQLYPDKRSMGYPFDRRAEIETGQEVDTLATFARLLPNTTLGECTIKFTNTIINRTA